MSEADAVSATSTWVKALFSYTSDDHTSLSFKQGDVIQVLSKLESGWWDGVINGQRGWFPSNYCALVDDAQARRLDEASAAEYAAANDRHASAGEHDYDSLDSDDETASGDEDPQLMLSRPAHDSVASRHEQLARHGKDSPYWIPQVTEDGTLFYFNTMTGATTTELPLESSHSLPARSRSSATNVDPDAMPHNSPDGLGQTKKGGGDGEQELDAKRVYESFPAARPRASYLSDGASPTTSMESLSSLPGRRQGAMANSSSATSVTQVGNDRRSTRASVASTYHHVAAAAIPAQFLDHGLALHLTWDKLLDDVRASTEHFKLAVLKEERDLLVRRAEDISDHVRLILTAGSGTTDNHSGNASIITANKHLYPKFRDMMSRFAKLALDSHINAADFAPNDIAAKCLQDADVFLDGVQAYIAVARQQRGEDIPRLVPGFVGEQLSGANWRNNGLLTDAVTHGASFPECEDDEADAFAEPHIRLDAYALAQMAGMRQDIDAAMQALAKHLVVKEKLISNTRHARITRHVSEGAKAVVDQYRPWMSYVESITLAPLGTQFPSTSQLPEFTEQKQRIYNLMASFIMACQALGAPLADEWARDRGVPLEERMSRVVNSVKELEATTSLISHSLQLLANAMPAMTPAEKAQASRRHQNKASVSSRDGAQSVAAESSSSTPMLDSKAHAAGLYANADGKKVQKIFGQAPVPVSPPRASVGSRDRASIPAFLKLDFDGEIMYDEATNPPTIKGGTLNGLIEQLTRHDTNQINFRDTFLLTYQSFVEGSELFRMLILRWSIQPPLGLSPDDYALWVKEKQEPIRIRVTNILRTWVGQYWMEEDKPESQYLLQQIYGFVEDTKEASTEAASGPLLNIIEQRIKGQDPTAGKRLTTSFVEGPTPKLPKNMKKFKFSDIDPIEFARQLTITESRLYCLVKPHECLNKLWTIKAPQGSDSEPAPNIKGLIRHSNQITNWVADMVLAPGEIKKRAAVIKYFIAVADQCSSLGNFSTLTSILAALGHSTIHRLNRTWNAVDKKSKEVLAKLDETMSRSKNFSNYRERLHSCSPPCIPFVGIYLTDLIFIEEGIPSLIKHTDLINFYKRSKTAEVIREIMNYQNVSYPFKTIPEIQSYIADKKEQAGNIHEMYNRSLKIEPREREDEKIARLLSESGFL